MPRIDSITAELAQYLADTVLPGGGEVHHDEARSTTAVSLLALTVLAEVPDDFDGHFDGRHIWIGGSGYEVTDLESPTYIVCGAPDAEEVTRLSEAIATGGGWYIEAPGGAVVINGTARTALAHLTARDRDRETLSLGPEGFWFDIKAAKVRPDNRTGGDIHLMTDTDEVMATIPGNQPAAVAQSSQGITTCLTMVGVKGNAGKAAVLLRRGYTQVTGLPAPKPGVVVVVQRAVADALPGRTDLVWPDGPVTDGSGTFLGWRDLAGHIG